MGSGDPDMIPVWRIPRVDPGFLYIIAESGRLKIGKAKDRISRLRAARTWLPDMTVVGIKPFWRVTRAEKQIHEGLCQFWYSGEWFDLGTDPYHEVFITDFTAFSDIDIDQNSINFLYWMHDFGEFAMERSRRRQSLRAFQRECSYSSKST